MLVLLGCPHHRPFPKNVPCASLLRRERGYFGLCVLPRRPLPADRGSCCYRPVSIFPLLLAVGREHQGKAEASAAHPQRETMKTTFNKKQLPLAVACALALSFASSAARAQKLTPDLRELWTAAPTQVWKNGFGECWHSAFGPPPGYGECNPAPVAQYVAPTPAAYVAPIAAAAPQPVYEKVTLDANVLFDFDKSTLRPAGRDILDDFVTKMNGLESATIAA